MSWPDGINQQALPALPPLSRRSTLSSLPWGGAYAAYYGLDLEKDYPGLRHYLGRVASGGQAIAVQVFSLPGAHSTAFVYHGFYDHVGLFNNVIDYCLRHGCSVVAADLPGHGLSSGERAAIDDFLCYRQVLRDTFGAVEPFGLPSRRLAFAQSTGCAIVMSHLLDGGEADFDRAVLMAPLVHPQDWWWGKPAHSVLKYFIHSLPRKFADNSDDQAFLTFLRERDPLQPRRLPLSWVGALKKWLPWFHARPPSMAKVLVIQGDADETVDWRYNLPVIADKFPRRQLVMLPGARHHLVKEGERFRAQLWQACDGFLFGEGEG